MDGQASESLANTEMVLTLAVQREADIRKIRTTPMDPRGWRSLWQAEE